MFAQNEIHHQRRPHGTRGWLIASLLWVGVSLQPGNAQAQNYEGGIDSVRWDAHLSLGWYSNVGAGFRADIPAVKGGLVNGVADDLSISVGAELLYFTERNYDGFGIWPLVAAQWNFYVHENWSVFPELGIAFWFGPDRDHYWGNGFAAPFLGVGGRYHFSARNALLVRINWPAGLQVGINF
jgi:hypothetical protein